MSHESTCSWCDGYTWTALCFPGCWFPWCSPSPPLLLVLMWSWTSCVDPVVVPLFRGPFPDLLLLCWHDHRYVDRMVTICVSVTCPTGMWKKRWRTTVRQMMTWTPGRQWTTSCQSTLCNTRRVRQLTAAFACVPYAWDCAVVIPGIFLLLLFLQLFILFFVFLRGAD